MRRFEDPSAGVDLSVLRVPGFVYLACWLVTGVIGCMDTSERRSALPSPVHDDDLDGRKHDQQASAGDDGIDGFFGTDQASGTGGHDGESDSIDGGDGAIDSLDGIVSSDGETTDEPLPGLSRIGVACADDSTCDGGTCVATDNGAVCSSTCVGAGCAQACDTFCPSGFMCIAQPELDAVSCIPAHAALCRPCILDSDCTSAGPAKCVTYENGSRFCATPCDSTLPCPFGYECQSIDGLTACISATGQCQCAPGADGASTVCTVTTNAGSCNGNRICQGDILTPCDAQIPSPEACDTVDNNCNGLTDEGCGTPDILDSDSDGTADEFDCQPLDAAIYPGAPESCNGVDDNCNGATDEPGTFDCQVFYSDEDDDGWGAGTPICQCTPSATYSASLGGDCDDGVDSVFPGAAEQCNGADDDCDGQTDEGNICGSPTPVDEVCYPGPANSGGQCFPLVNAASVTSSAYAWPAASSAPVASWYQPPARLIDLTAVDASLSIAPNFTLAEFAQSWKGQWAVVRPEMVSKWQAIRAALGTPLYINSGFRSPGYNAGLDDAATYSRHMYGDAGDVQTGGATSLQAIADQCENQNAYYIKLYVGHVHCDWRDIPLGQDFWPGAGKPGTMPVIPEPPVWADVPMPEANEWRVGRTLQLAARWTGFDEGTPFVRWQIIPPGSNSGSVWERQTDVAVVLDRPGLWVIRWSVGGVVHGKLEQIVP